MLFRSERVVRLGVGHVPGEGGEIDSGGDDAIGRAPRGDHVPSGRPVDGVQVDHRERTPGEVLPGVRVADREVPVVPEQLQIGRCGEARADPDLAVLIDPRRRLGARAGIREGGGLDARGEAGDEQQEGRTSDQRTPSAACAAASRATGTRNGEHET